MFVPGLHNTNSPLFPPGPELDKRQDPISFDKLEDMLVSYLNKILGTMIDTRRLDIGVPSAFIADTLNQLKPYHSSRKEFRVKDMEGISGKLIFIAGTAPWLKLIMASLFRSVAAALGENQAYLTNTSKRFRLLLKQSRDSAASQNVQTFAQGEAAREVHGCKKTHFINTTMREELHLIIRVLESRRVKHRFRTPIAHLVRRDPSATAWSDSCLYAAGGYSVDMKFWWYIEWPDKVRQYTLKYNRTNKDGNLIR